MRIPSRFRLPRRVVASYEGNGGWRGPRRTRCACALSTNHLQIDFPSSALREQSNHFTAQTYRVVIGLSTTICVQLLRQTPLQFTLSYSGVAPFHLPLISTPARCENPACSVLRAGRREWETRNEHHTRTCVGTGGKR